jgi:hypothetical protein
VSLFPVKSPLSVALCPGQVALTWREAGAVRTMERSVPASLANGGEWSSALATLAECLQAENTRGRRLAIVLSNRFARYALAPWPTRSLGRRALRAWHRLALEAAAAGPMDGWRIAADAGTYGQSQLVCAVPEQLLVDLNALCARDGLVLGPALPHFILAWNRWRRRLVPGRLFGVADSDRIVFARHGKRGWDTLRMLSARLSAERLVQLARREHSLEGEDEFSALLYAPGMKPPADSQTQAIDWPFTDPGDDSTLGMGLDMALCLARR